MLTPSGLCCLQTGHWTFECKGQATYLARPSASKQLQNPVGPSSRRADTMYGTC